jgi:ABC-type transporter Mla MlaB component
VGADPGEHSILITCDVELRGVCDLAAIAALARLRLEADRLGCQLQVSGGSQQLVDLIRFVGLDEILLTPRPQGDGDGSA